MSENSEIRRMIADSLEKKGRYRAEVIEVDGAGSRSSRMKNLEELMEEFDSDQTAGAQWYFVSVAPNEPITRPFGATPPAPPIKEEQTPEFLVKQARILEAAGDISLAKRIYESIYSNGERSAAVFRGLAHCFEKEGDWVRAIRFYEEAVAHETSLLSYEELMSALMSQKRFQGAGEVAMRALVLPNLPPESKERLNLVAGDCWLSTGQVQRAIEHYQQAGSLELGSVEPKLRLGSAYLRSGAISQAIDVFTDVENKDARNSRAIFGLGCAYVVKNETKLAYQCFLDSLRIELSNPTALFYLIKMAFKLKKYSETETLLVKYLDQSPVSASLLYCLAVLQYHLGKYPEVTKSLGRLRAVKPDHEGLKRLGDLIKKAPLK